MPCCSTRERTETAASCVIEDLFAHAGLYGVLKVTPTPVSIEPLITIQQYVGLKTRHHAANGLTGLEVLEPGAAPAEIVGRTRPADQPSKLRHVQSFDFMTSHASRRAGFTYVNEPSNGGAGGCNRSCSGIQPSTASRAACMSAPALG